MGASDWSGLRMTAACACRKPFKGQHKSACLADGDKLQVSLQLSAFRDALMWGGKAVCTQRTSVSPNDPGGVALSPQ